MIIFVWKKEEWDKMIKMPHKILLTFGVLLIT